MDGLINLILGILRIVIGIIRFIIEVIWSIVFFVVVLPVTLAVAILSYINDKDNANKK